MRLKFNVHRGGGKPEEAPPLSLFLGDLWLLLPFIITRSHGIFGLYVLAFTFIISLPRMYPEGRFWTTMCLAHERFLVNHLQMKWGKKKRKEEKWRCQKVRWRRRS